jgi:hypothetical protein
MLAMYPTQGTKRRSKTPVANFPLTIKPPFKNNQTRIFRTAFPKTESGTDIATSEPTEAVTEAVVRLTQEPLTTGFQMLTGAAE